MVNPKWIEWRIGRSKSEAWRWWRSSFKVPVSNGRLKSDYDNYWRWWYCPEPPLILEKNNS